jgi:hypothetical protein
MKRALFALSIVIFVPSSAAAEPGRWTRLRNTVNRTIRQVKRLPQYVAKVKHNRKVDADERLSFKEYLRYAKQEKLPARVEPKAVLVTKLGRAKSAVWRMEAYTAALDRTCTKIKDKGPFKQYMREAEMETKLTWMATNEAVGHLSSALSYARKRGLSPDGRARRLAGRGVAALRTYNSALNGSGLTFWTLMGQEHNQFQGAGKVLQQVESGSR